MSPLESADSQARPAPPLVAIVGPTAAGKSALAMQLAPRFDGEIVSADSRQVYRFMDIGTAKPSLEERAAVPHHLIDLVDPDEPFTLAQYQRLAFATIDEIHARGRLPLLVGGTGLYVRAVLDGLNIPAVPPNPDLRAQLEAIAKEQGGDALVARLREVDPVAAERIDPRNLRRVIRAIEVYEATGRAFSEFQRSSPPNYRVLKLGVDLPRQLLFERIDRRIDEWIAGGLIEETKRLLDRGYSPDLPAMSGIGYRELAAYLAGECTLEAAVQAMKHATHRLARHQYAWFRPGDETIHWLRGDDPATPEVAAQLIAAHVAGQSTG